MNDTTFTYEPSPKPKQPKSKFPGTQRAYKQVEEGYFVDSQGRKYYQDIKGTFYRLKEKRRK